MSNFMRSIPITPDMVSLWVPSGLNRAQDLIRGNHGQCYGTHPNVPVISPPIDQINACDATTGWDAPNGSLSIDTSDKKEGTGSLKNIIASPLTNTWYYTRYNETGDSLDWSNKEYFLAWLYCDRASTAFTTPTLRIEDTSANVGYFDLTFSAATWTAFRFLLPSVDSGSQPNLALIDNFIFQLRTKDTTAFYLKIDDVRVTGKPSVINPSVGWVFGGDDRIDVLNALSLKSDKGTIAFWAKFPAVLSQEPIIQIYDTIGTMTEDYLLVRRLSEGTVHLVVEDDNATKVALKSTNTVVDGKWHPICVTQDGVAAKIFLDGIEETTTGTNSGYWTNHLTVLNIRIGRSAWQFLDGDIALLSVSNEAWSQAKVDNFILNTKGLFAPRAV